MYFRGNLQEELKYEILVNTLIEFKKSIDKGVNIGSIELLDKCVANIQKNAKYSMFHSKTYIKKYLNEILDSLCYDQYINYGNLEIILSKKCMDFLIMEEEIINKICADILNKMKEDLFCINDKLSMKWVMLIYSQQLQEYERPYIYEAIDRLANKNLIECDEYNNYLGELILTVEGYKHIYGKIN